MHQLGHYNLVSLIFGTTIPTSLNILMKCFLRLYIYNWHCTYRNAIRASNFACALSRSPTMLSIPLVLTNVQISRNMIHYIHLYLSPHTVMHYLGRTSMRPMQHIHVYTSFMQHYTMSLSGVLQKISSNNIIRITK